MSLATFFDKSALAAAEVLSGFDYAEFERILSEIVVQLAYDSAAVATSEGRFALDMSVRLLSRIYPTLAIKPLDGAAEHYRSEFEKLAKQINPEITTSTETTRPNVSIVVGNTAIDTNPAFYAGSDNWIAKLSTSGPVGSGESNNPLAAGASACFAAANAFRCLFRTQLFEGEPDAGFSLSLLDFTLNLQNTPNPPIEGTSLGELPIAGLGAIGSAIVWSFANLRGIEGELHLIDPEKIELSNLQRYASASFAEIGAYKAESSAKFLHDSKLKAIPYKCTWGEYVASRRELWMDTVLVAVDSAKTRCEIQGILPRLIVNSWTQPTDLGISRHGFLGEAPCLMCLYLPDREVPSEDQEIAAALNMSDPESVTDIRERLFKGIPLDMALIERIAAAKSVPIEPLKPFIGRSLRDFYSRAVCGGLLLTLNPSSELPRQPVPMAFQSALCGILAAAEVIAAKSNLRTSPLDTMTRVNLLRPITRHLNFAETKHPYNRCICKDADFMNAYQEHWGSPVT